MQIDRPAKPRLFVLFHKRVATPLPIVTLPYQCLLWLIKSYHYHYMNKTRSLFEDVSSGGTRNGLNPSSGNIIGHYVMFNE